MFAHRPSRRNRPAPPRRPLSRPSFEQLEARQVLTCDLASLIGNAFGGAYQHLAQLEAAVDSQIALLGEVPLAGDFVTNHAAEVKQPLVDVRERIKQVADAALNWQNFQLSDVQSKILPAFDVNGRQLLTLPDGTPMSDAADVGLTYDDVNCGVDLQLSFGLALDTAAPVDASFGLGVGSLPIRADSGQPPVSSPVQARLGFQIPNLHFGYDAASGFSFDSSSDSEATLQVAAAFAPGAAFKAQIGFLLADVSDGQSDGSATSSLSLAIPLDIDAAGGVAASYAVQADVYLVAATQYDGAFPGISADFELHAAYSSDDSVGVVSAGFKHVRLDLGDALSSILGDTVTLIQDVTKPIMPLIELAQARLPVLSDIPILNSFLNADGDANEDVSLLDVALTAGSLAEVPNEYSALIELAAVLIQITDTVNELTTSGDGNIQIDLGGFDLVDGVGQGLRAVGKADYVDPGDAADLQNSALVDPRLKIDNFDSVLASFDAVQAAYHAALDDHLPVLANSLDDMFARLDDGIQLTFPMFSDPAGTVFQLLIGRDVDLFHLHANYDFHAPIGAPDIPVPGLPIDMRFGGHVDAHVNFDIGYDTFGLRKMLGDGFHNPTALVDGLYLSHDSTLNLIGDLTASASVTAAVVEAGVSGGLYTGVALTVANTIADLDGDHTKDRFHGELEQYMFNASGDVSARLDAWVKIGVETPLGDLDVAEVTYNIASVELVSFNSGDVPNPRYNPDPDLASLDTVTGQLTLFMGPWGGSRNVGIGKENESFFVYQVPEFSGIVTYVSAFGYTEKIELPVNSIVADGGSGDDRVVIDDSVAVPLSAWGGAGRDVFIYRGSSDATIDGGADDDQLEGGPGPVNSLIGGPGNDTLIGGGTGPSTLNVLGHMLLETGDDEFFPGGGINQMFGGPGRDHLRGGTLADYLDGGDDDDLLDAGEGPTTLIGWRGDDQITWIVGDGHPVIDGGGGSDTVAIFGTPGDDVFSASELAGLVTLKVPGDAFDVQAVERIQFEGQHGVDDITIGSLVGTTIERVDVNVGDIANLDDVADHVYVLGTNGIDGLTVENESVFTKKHVEGAPTDGGVTKITGLPSYLVRVANVVDDVRIQTLDNSDTIDVHGVTGPTVVEGGDGFDTFNVTSGDYSAMLGLLTLETGAGSALVTFHTVASNGAPDVDVTSDQLLAHWPAPSGGAPRTHVVQLSATGGGDFTSGVLVFTTDGADSVRVLSTRAGVATTIDTAGGDDTVTVGGAVSGGSLSLDSIVGPLSIDTGLGAANRIILNDSAATAGNANVIVSATSVDGFAGPADSTAVTFLSTGGSTTLQLDGATSSALNERFTLNGPLATVELNASGGNEQFAVNQLSFPATIDGGAGADIVNVTPAGNLVAAAGGLQFVGGVGVDSINLFDTAAGAGANYSLTASSLSRVGAAGVGFAADVESINAATSATGATIVVQTNPLSTTQVKFNAGAGVDVLQGPNVGNNRWQLTGLGDVTLNSNVKASGVESLTGGLGDDTFVFQPNGKLAGLIDGQGGVANTLDYSAVTYAVTVN
ncbi:MAG TPA: hypothetical protein PLV92_02130, partial [Pirellulaceae bacterium]|nr:hypothetical protein [Pirellulaceae bacterium]